MSIEEAVTWHLRRVGTDIFSGVYSAVVTRVAPYAHEAVRAVLERMVSDGKVRPLKSGNQADPEYTLVSMENE